MRAGKDCPAWLPCASSRTHETVLVALLEGLTQLFGLVPTHRLGYRQVQTVALLHFKAHVTQQFAKTLLKHLDAPVGLVLAAAADLGGFDRATKRPALGQTVRARVSGRLPGDLEVHAEGANTRVTAHANIDADGMLGLNRDAELALNVTPSLVDGYLSLLHPFLNEVQSAEQPLRLLLSADGFRMPLAANRPEEIRARGRLEIGTLNMNRGAITLALFGALRELGGDLRPGSNDLGFDLAPAGIH